MAAYCLNDGLKLERIVVLGCAGAGKTALSVRLGVMLTLPVISLDAIWPSGCERGDPARFQEEMRALHAGDLWVSDGNFAEASFAARLPRATLILWLEQPRARCMHRALRRLFRRGEQHRWRGLRDVLMYIWHFDRVSRPRIEAARQSWGAQIPVRRLRGDQAVAAFLVECGQPTDTGRLESLRPDTLS